MTLRRLTAAVPVVVGLTVLAGCANSDGQVLAHQACGHVDSSLTLYHESLNAPAAQAATERAAALTELRRAMPIAATAAGEAPQWQALMATLAESSRGVPESYLVGALQQQCTTTPPDEAPSVPLTTVPIAPTHPTTAATNP